MVGALLFLGGAVLVAGEVALALGDPYDSGYLVHAVFGAIYAVVGLALGAGGWFLTVGRMR